MGTRSSRPNEAQHIASKFTIYITVEQHFDLSAALEYYGSDRARIDFLSNREPLDLIIEEQAHHRRTSDPGHKNHERTTSVVDHLFEGDPTHFQDHHHHHGGSRFGKLRKVVRDLPANGESSDQAMNVQRQKLMQKLGFCKTWILFIT